MYSPVEERRLLLNHHHQLRNSQSWSSIPRTNSVLQLQPPLLSPQSSRRIVAQTSDIQRMPITCKHFHYHDVELGPVNVQRIHAAVPSHPMSTPDLACWRFRVTSNDRVWTIERSYRQTIDFDRQLHRCVFDRRFSRLSELRPIDGRLLRCSIEQLISEIDRYFERLSDLTGSVITCYPVLKWLELDSRGNRFMAAEETPINTPAIAAAFVVREHTATSCDQLNLKLGDILSVIEMPAPQAGQVAWWKAKLTISAPANSAPYTIPHFEVGYFPSYCVQLFNSKSPTTVYSTTSQSPSSTHQQTSPSSYFNGNNNGNNKMVSFVRDLLHHRPKLLMQHRSVTPKCGQTFGVDLVEYLESVGQTVPMIVEQCVRAIEQHGMVTGIYRQSGIQSNIHRLRNQFDHGIVADLNDPIVLRDVHCISSLLKQYFRQLPNPLFTYQLYDSFVEAMAMTNGSKRMSRFKDVIRELPPPHYRTAEYLMRHLCRLCNQSAITDMTSRNLAIVWAPNLFRAPPPSTRIDVDDCHLLRGVHAQATVCEYTITNADVLFATDEDGDSGVLSTATIDNTIGANQAVIDVDERLVAAQREKVPKSAGLPDLSNRQCVDVNGGPSALPKHFHTIIEHPKKKRDRIALWKVLFGSGKRSNSTGSTSSPTKTDTDESTPRSARSRIKGWDQRRSEHARRRAYRQQQQHQSIDPTSSTDHRHQQESIPATSISLHADDIRWRKEPNMRSVRSAESIISAVARNVEEWKDGIVQGWRNRNLATRTMSSIEQQGDDNDGVHRHYDHHHKSQQQSRPKSAFDMTESTLSTSYHKLLRPFSPDAERDMPYMETDFDGDNPMTKQIRVLANVSIDDDNTTTTLSPTTVQSTTSTSPYQNENATVLLGVHHDDERADIGFMPSPDHRQALDAVSSLHGVATIRSASLSSKSSAEGVIVDDDDVNSSLYDLSQVYSSCEESAESNPTRRVSFATDCNNTRNVHHHPQPDHSFESINTVLQSLENLPKSPAAMTLPPKSTSSTQQQHPTNLLRRHSSNDSVRLDLSRYDNVSPTAIDDDDRSETPTVAVTLSTSQSTNSITTSLPPPLVPQFRGTKPNSVRDATPPLFYEQQLTGAVDNSTTVIPLDHHRTSIEIYYL